MWESDEGRNVSYWQASQEGLKTEPLGRLERKPMSASSAAESPDSRPLICWRKPGRKVVVIDDGADRRRRNRTDDGASDATRSTIVFTASQNGTARKKQNSRRKLTRARSTRSRRSSRRKRSIAISRGSTVICSKPKTATTISTRNSKPRIAGLRSDRDRRARAGQRFRHRPMPCSFPIRDSFTSSNISPAWRRRSSRTAARLFSNTRAVEWRAKTRRR